MQPENFVSRYRRVDEVKIVFTYYIVSTQRHICDLFTYQQHLTIMESLDRLKKKNNKKPFGLQSQIPLDE